MLPQVDFYVLKNTEENACNLLACKLAAKALTAQQSMYIHCATQQQAVAIDDMLWSFNDISFIPHALSTAENSGDIPILLGYDTIPERQYEILLNLNAEVPTQAEHFKRIIEIVYQDPDAKKSARAHYKTYQERNFPLKSHNL